MEMHYQGEISMVVFEKWNKKGTKVFGIYWYRKSWKENGTKPMFKFFTNGAKKKNGDNCLDVELIVGYLIINYVNYNLQKK